MLQCFSCSQWKHEDHVSCLEGRLTNTTWGTSLLWVMGTVKVTQKYVKWPVMVQQFSFPKKTVSHVTEQMGTALRKLILTHKGEQIFDSFMYQSKIHFRNLWLGWCSQYLITLAPNNFLLGVRGALIKIKMNAYTMLSGVWPQKNNTPPNKRQV